MVLLATAAGDEFYLCAFWGDAPHDGKPVVTRDELTRLLRGLGKSACPANLDHVVWAKLEFPGAVVIAARRFPKRRKKRAVGETVGPGVRTWAGGLRVPEEQD